MFALKGPEGLTASMRSPFCHASFLQSARERPELEMTLLSEVPVGFIYRPLHRSLPSFPQPHYHSMNFLLPLVLELDSIDICIESSPLCTTAITPTPTHLNAVTQFAATPSVRRMRSNMFTTPSWHHQFSSLTAVSCTDTCTQWCLLLSVQACMHTCTPVSKKLWVSAVHEGERLHFIKRRAKSAGKSSVNGEELFSFSTLYMWVKLPVSKAFFIIIPKRDIRRFPKVRTIKYFSKQISRKWIFEYLNECFGFNKNLFIAFMS